MHYRGVRSGFGALVIAVLAAVPAIANAGTEPFAQSSTLRAASKGSSTLPAPRRAAGSDAPRTRQPVRPGSGRAADDPASTPVLGSRRKVQSRTTTSTTTLPAPTTTTTAPAPPPARLDAGDIVYDGGLAGDRFEIFTMRPDGSGVRQLTDDVAYNSWWPRPSPDRSRVLFYRTPAGVPPVEYERASLWLMNADGSGAHVLLPEAAFGWTFQAHAEWSPDGSTIVFTAATTQALIMTIAPDGSNLRVLGGGPGANVDPSFSPDGKSIVYVGCPSWTCTPATSEVFIMPADGNGPRVQLTSDTIRDQDPRLSPDGTRVAFLSQTAPPSADAPHGEWHLRLVGRDGSGVRQITTGPALESAPWWSPDGTRLFTHRTVLDGWVWDITSMRPDGSDIRAINLPFTQEFPAIA
jgi:Tol biopolymer transport system component